MKSKFAISMLLTCVLSVLLAGCSGLRSSLATQPAAKELAAYPRQTPIAQYPPNPPLVYHASMELLVKDVDTAAAQAVQLAIAYGGYLSGSNTWIENDAKTTLLELAVPPANLEELRSDVRTLGVLVSETVDTQPAPPGSPIYPSYTTLVVQLRQSGLILPPLPETGWHPWRTFQSAFGVFLTIFGFIVDILIWVLVVAGPFVLIGLLVYWIARRARRPALPPVQNPDVE